MADDKGGAGAGGAAGGGADAGKGGAAGGATGADAGTSLLDPSLDKTEKGGAGGSSSNAEAEAAAAAAAAKAGDKGGANKGGEGAQTGAPEKYSDFKAPEGVVIDPEIVKEFTPLAKELNLSQEAAQKLVDFQSKIGLRTVDEKLKEFNDIKKGWEEQTQKELGATYQAERALAAKARDKYIPPVLMQLLNDSGVGSHPEFFKFIAKLGRDIAEDNLAGGKPAGGGADETVKPTSEVLFGKTTPPKK